MSATPKTSTTYAIKLAPLPEGTRDTGAVEDDDFVEGTLNWVEDCHGALRLVLTLDDCRAELVLGDGEPRVDVWWAAKPASSSLDPDQDVVDGGTEVWWRAVPEGTLGS